MEIEMGNLSRVTKWAILYDVQLFSLVYAKGVLTEIPQLQTPFDCVVVNRKAELGAGEIEAFARELVGLPVDWVEVLGDFSEEIHDAVDIASVAIGRQSAVGDGDPMTAWDYSVITDQDVAERLLTGGPGGTDSVAIIVLGDTEAEKRLIAEFQDLLEKENGL